MALTLDGATVALGGRDVLRSMSAQFADGRVTVVLGPNGAGKSTLAQLIAGILTPHAGAALIDGAPIAGLTARDRARRIGYLPQALAAHWDMRVEELVALGRLPHRGAFAALSTTDREAIAAAMAATDTQRFASRSIGTLSGGEAARVHLARVLAGTPDWIIADEPLEGLDPAHRLEVLDRLRAAAMAGAGVIVILHDLTHAARVADDALLIRDGEIVAMGAARDVLTPAILAPVYGVRLFEGVDDEGAPLLIPVARLP